MANSITTQTNLSGVMQIFYDKVFLERAKANMVYDYAADKKALPMNSGKTIYWNRFSPLAVATTALTEATNPTEAGLTSTLVTASVAEYGNYTVASSLFELTSLDQNLSEHVSVHGQNAGETLDTLIAAQLSANGTAQLASGNTFLTDLGTTDTFTGLEVRRAVRTLKRNKAYAFAGGLFRGIVSVGASYDLRGNSEWLDASRYVAPGSTIQNGLLGRLHGVEFVETNNEVTESSTTTVYHNFICGMHAYGIVDIAGTSEPKVFVKNPSQYDTNNPLNLYSTVGWKATFAAKVLNANWVIDVKVGATA